MTHSASILLSVVSDSFLRPMGSIADAQREHLIRVVLLTLIAVGPVFIAAPLILWRYRRGNAQAAYRPKWNSNKLLESLMWGVPMLVITLLGITLWRMTHTLDPYRSLSTDPIRLQVIGLDWKWVFLYPDEGVATVDELIVPTGRAVSMHLTTDTVMQSFRVSALIGQVYAMPGMVTEIHLIAAEDGEMRGMNTQFSGLEFWKQKFEVHAREPNDFAHVMDQARNSGLSLTPEVYALLAEQGTADEARPNLGVSKDTPLRFALPDKDLFMRVVARYHTGKPVNAPSQPGSPSYQPSCAVPPPADAPLYMPMSTHD